MFVYVEDDENKEVDKGGGNGMRIVMLLRNTRKGFCGGTQMTDARHLSCVKIYRSVKEGFELPIND